MYNHLPLCGCYGSQTFIHSQRMSIYLPYSFVRFVSCNLLLATSSRTGSYYLTFQNLVVTICTTCCNSRQCACCTHSSLYFSKQHKLICHSVKDCVLCEVQTDVMFTVRTDFNIQSAAVHVCTLPSLHSHQPIICPLLL